jgi:NAD(P)-dependent dehydrogenase (short-subunit alcohol dehydrogenase family)
MNLEGKTAVVTGASRGLGAGLAADFARRGMRLGLCSRGAAALSPGERVLAQRVDVADAEAVARFGDAVAERFGGIDLWINNAGVLDPIGPLRDCAAADLDRHLQINVLGVIWGSRWYCRHRRAVGPGGVLVNISSGAARKAYFGWSAYCAGKAAVDRLTECIALEEKDAGLRAHAVAPGIIDTYMQEQIRATTAAQFPEVGRFVALKQDEKFSSTAWVASHLLELAFGDGATDQVLVALPLERT